MPFKLRYYRISFCLTTLFLSPIVVLIALDIYGTSVINRSSIYTAALILFFPGILCAAYSIWVCPYRSTDDDTFIFVYGPRSTIKLLSLMVWLPTIVLIVCGMIFVTNFNSHIGLTLRTTFHDLNFGLGTILIATILGIPSFLISRRLRPRMVVMTRRRLICFECAYDLRNIEHATNCPECGVSIPWINKIESNTPSSIPCPTGHDRA